MYRRPPVRGGPRELEAEGLRELDARHAIEIALRFG